jgi:hypothetical protein
VSTTEELLERKVASPVFKTENTAVGIRHADNVVKVDTNFADKRRSLGRYSTLADSDHGVCLFSVSLRVSFLFFEPCEMCNKSVISNGRKWKEHSFKPQELGVVWAIT